MEEYTAAQLAHQIEEVLKNRYGYYPREATLRQIYGSVLIVVNDELAKRRGRFLDKLSGDRPKHIYYLSMEFLMGTSLHNHLYNLQMESAMQEAVKSFGISLSDLYELEPDAGLGNGGLGRLASCYLDAATTMEYPITGFSIRYEFGIFKQKIVDGWQMEYPDNWLELGSYWLTPRPDEAVEVRFGGHVQESWTEDGLKTTHLGYQSVRAVPYDMFISGHNSEAINSLRLWRAESADLFDMNTFSRGEYVKSMEQNARAESISKVLYPADDHIEGKRLRLRQQYFFVSASLQNIITEHLLHYETLDDLAEHAVIQINDTHPSLCVPELMRILLDQHHYPWEKAWDIVTHTLAYTNHTVMAEALETWDIGLFSAELPRIYRLVEEIDKKFCQKIYKNHPEKSEAISSMRILANGQVHMANLCLIACFAVNGVSALHTDILKTDTFRDFHEIYPYKILNITNGIAARRWLCQSNPRLSALICDMIGDGFCHDLFELKKLLAYTDDSVVLEKLQQIKQQNKEALARYIAQQNGILVNSSARFDVQVKRLHEYKRQLMNALHICHLYLQIRDHGLSIYPTVFLFGAKASPGYLMAKEMIRFICALADMINKDRRVNQQLQVVFLEDYRVSLAEKIYPASEVSEQISLAGKEASGTGNMKMMLNGAITLGTMDGANIEIWEAVGTENMVVFGQTASQAVAQEKSGYQPHAIYETQPYVKEVMDFIAQEGVDGKNFSALVDYLLTKDPYMMLWDFESYRLAQAHINERYQNVPMWNKSSLVNIANAGIFSADRSVDEYVKKIWYR